MAIRGGCAVREITPTWSVPLFGYGRVQRLSTAVHDPLLACAIHVRSGSAKIILVTLDLLCLDPSASRRIRTAVARSAGLPEDLVLVGCTHTHSGPVTMNFLSWADDSTVTEPDPKYIEFVSRQAVQAAAEAAATSRPVELAWTTASLPPDAPEAAAGPIACLALRAEGGGPFFAMALVCGVRPAILEENSIEVSADFPHYTRESLKARFGANFVVLHYVAPCAERDGDPDPARHTFAEAERVGRAVGEAAAKSLEALPREAFSVNPELTGKRKSVQLPRRTYPSLWDARVRWGTCRAEFDRLSKAQADPAKARAAKRALIEAEGTVALLGAHNSGKIDEVLVGYGPIEVQVVRVGEACLAGLPGMIASEYGRRLAVKATRKTYAVNQVNGDLQGHIVTPPAAAAGRWGPTPSPFAPQAGDALIEAAASLVPAS